MTDTRTDVRIERMRTWRQWRRALAERGTAGCKRVDYPDGSVSFIGPALPYAEDGKSQILIVEWPDGTESACRTVTAKPGFGPHRVMLSASGRAIGSISGRLPTDPVHPSASA